MPAVNWRTVAWREAQAHARYGQAPGADGRAFGPLVAVHAGPDSPLSAAWHDGTRVPEESDWVAFESFCAERGQTPTLHVLSGALPGLLPSLRARGYVLSGVLHLYIHDLDVLSRPFLTVSEAASPAQWARLAAAGFGPETRAVMNAVARAPQTALYTAEIGGRKVATGALSLVGGGAALHGTSTLPAFRGRGAQGALLAARLLFARRHGADQATVFVTPDSASERNVQRSGFALAGARLTFSRPE